MTAAVMSPVRCACCRSAIAGAVRHLTAVHARCWSAAGQRIRRVRLAAITRREQAERAVWLAEYVGTEQALQAGGWL